VLGAIRGEVHRRIANPEARKKAFERVVSSGIVDWIAEYDDPSAIEKARQMIKGME
jgi:hypothetical protein